MPMTIAIVMLAVAAAIMLLFAGAPAGQIVKTKTCQAASPPSSASSGLAWLGDTFIDANSQAIIGGL